MCLRSSLVGPPFPNSPFVTCDRFETFAHRNHCALQVPYPLGENVETGELSELPALHEYYRRAPIKTPGVTKRRDS
jgi:hypothetical protein